MHHQWNKSGEEFECYTKTMREQQRAWSHPSLTATFRSAAENTRSGTLATSVMEGDVQGTQRWAAPVRSETGHADQGPARLWTGVWHHRDGGVANRSVGREKQGKQVRSRMDDICYTTFQVPMETRINTPTPFLFLPTRAAHTHHARTHARHGSRQTRAAGGVQQLCCSSPLLLFDFLPSTSVG